MRSFLKKLFFFRVGQKTSQIFARALGYGRLSVLIGLIGGIRSMRRHA